ncbi:F-box only protein 5-like isoform X2 [Entelurus aequoreus]|uniref:F-box only protein 5-like isoform X2 n=1 Tax=Entelurus aequoreus TaxID=161455 RepID=UPI002B1E11AB|nr:F-box only protein 5-like isoform X2 [Entelurus aequoreus]
MKSAQYDIAKAKRSMEKGLQVEDSRSKDPLALKPQCPPAEKVAKGLPFHDSTFAGVNNKENRTLKKHDRTLEEVLEDSGYTSLYNSPLEIDDNPPKRWSWCQEGTGSGCGVPLLAYSTPVDKSRQQALTYSSSSTPCQHHDTPNLPILKFQQAVNEALARSYPETKRLRYDWSIISKAANDYPLHQVIGRHMGLEYVDVFSSLLSKNMGSILANILSLLGDMDLIRCRMVSGTWRKIICEDDAALRRCKQAEQMLQISSVKRKGCDLTRDQVVSRLVLSSTQKVASPHPPSPPSLSTSCGINRRSAPAQKNSKSTSRFMDFVQVASSLKPHESLRRCNRCGSPATHRAEVRRARCTRPSCQFDFCTRCQEAFHGSAPCRVVGSWSDLATSKDAVLPGSARSKRNLRRL